MLDIAALTSIDEDTTRLDVKLTDESRRVLAEELVEFPGPVAQMIVSDLDDEIIVDIEDPHAPASNGLSKQQPVCFAITGCL